MKTNSQIPNGMDDYDVDFMRKAATIGLFEIFSSRLARDQAANALARAFAEMMVGDHTRMTLALRELATKKLIPLPDRLDPVYDEMLSELERRMIGEDFDGAYCDLMLDSHKQAVEIFEEAAGSARDEDIRALARASLPILHGHQAHAEMLEKNVAR